MKLLTLSPLVLLVFFVSQVCAQGLWLPSIFSEKMVLQRDLPIPVWGKALPGAKITVSIYQANDLTRKLATSTTVADGESGRWRVNLESVSVQKRCSFLVEAKGPDKGHLEMRLFDNVMVGEVWITCGQSNSILPLDQCAGYAEALKCREAYPLMRTTYLGVRDSSQITTPQEETRGYWGLAKWHDSTWQIQRSSTKDVPGGQTGLSYFFARALTDYVGKDVPVGMINIAAILPAETWVSPEEVEARKDLHHLRGKGYPHATSRGYMANIMPLAPFAARGVIYYQGEMNGDRCNDYYHALLGLIASWRKVWERPKMPVLVVQLPGFIEHRVAKKHVLDMDEKSLATYTGKNTNHSWCYIRDAQLRVSQADPDVGLAVTIDLGEKFNIHPPRKRPVAERLVLQARKLAYGDTKVIADAPMPTAYTREGKSFVVTFDGIGDGLVVHAPEHKLAGFEVRDDVGKWYPAIATIEGKYVRVQTDTISQPTGVRYAWKGYPATTLYNINGLAATPFQYPEANLHQQQFEK